MTKKDQITRLSRFLGKWAIPYVENTSNAMVVELIRATLNGRRPPVGAPVDEVIAWFEGLSPEDAARFDGTREPAPEDQLPPGSEAYLAEVVRATARTTGTCTWTRYDTYHLSRGSPVSLDALMNDDAFRDWADESMLESGPYDSESEDYDNHETDDIDGLEISTDLEGVRVLTAIHDAIRTIAFIRDSPATEITAEVVNSMYERLVRLAEVEDIQDQDLDEIIAHEHQGPAKLALELLDDIADQGFGIVIGRGDNRQDIDSFADLHAYWHAEASAPNRMLRQINCMVDYPRLCAHLLVSDESLRPTLSGFGSEQACSDALDLVVPDLTPIGKSEYLESMEQFYMILEERNS